MVTKQTKKDIKSAARQLKLEEHPIKKETARSVFNHIIIFFMIGAIFGTYWEEILWFFKELIEQGEFVWVSRTGLLYGPFSPVYGIGAVLIYLVFYRTKIKPLYCFIFGAILGGALEFSLSLIQEWMFGTISWDYSTYPLNIQGRTTVPYMILWGALVWLFVTYIYPAIDRVYYRFAERSMNIFCTVMAVLLLLDAGISIAASVRQAERREGDPASNAVEEFLDDIYNDDRMKETYDNAEYVENK